MKHQYFGDINDYKKYGLLRVLSSGGAIRIAVCWMLTENDSRTDGNKISYLNEPERWRDYDPELFDILRHTLHNKRSRNVRHIEESDCLRPAVYHSEILTDEASQREEYFSSLLTKASGLELLFFDPDNGIEVKSVMYGRKNSCKYIYWHEIKAAYNAGHSLLIYQHFPRVEHRLYTARSIQQIQTLLEVSEVFAIATSSVLYLLVPQKHHNNYFQERLKALQNRWEENFLLFLFRPAYAGRDSSSTV
ncbi:MAG: hypothetical protein EPO24_00975 [Bacteroidetes bacterium]|nr:MAG: hypothetical protein EPO24_00975 [Bacteroidota bacterium]